MTYEERFWVAYHGHPSPPETRKERDEVESLLRDLVRETETAKDGSQK